MRFLVTTLAFIHLSVSLVQGFGNITHATHILTTTELASAPFNPLPLANNSSFPHEKATVEIQISGLAGSGVITFTNTTNTSSSLGLESPSHSTSGSIVHDDNSHQTRSFSAPCTTTSWANTTSTPLANSTFNFNATAGLSARQFATAMPTNLSIFTGAGVLSQRGALDISMYCSIAFIHIAVVCFI